MRGQSTRKAPRHVSAGSRIKHRKNVRWQRQPVKKRSIAQF